jgi:nucleoid DNA-binding protein
VTKKQFNKVLSEKLGVSIKRASEITEGFLETITEGLLTDNKVAFIGFGTFEKKFKAERTGVRNPKDGTECVVPAHNVVKFKVGSKLKDGVNE